MERCPLKSELLQFIQTQILQPGSRIEQAISFSPLPCVLIAVKETEGEKLHQGMLARMTG
jgi:hypothetical protein